MKLSVFIRDRCLKFKFIKRHKINVHSFNSTQRIKMRKASVSEVN